MNKIIMYCDGVCKDNQNYEISRGGFGALISYGDIQKELLGGEAPTTNNRMELNAIIQPLKLLKKPQEVIIFTDSMYVKKGMLEWRFNWVKRNWIKSDGEPVKNSELWKELLKLCEIHKVDFKWVKGHNGDPGNEKADDLANEGCIYAVDCKKKGIAPKIIFRDAAVKVNLIKSY